MWQNYCLLRARVTLLVVVHAHLVLLLLASGQLLYVLRQIVPPAPEEVPGELPQLPKFTISGALGRLELLRLDQKALFFESLLQFLPHFRLTRSAFPLG